MYRCNLTTIIKSIFNFFSFFPRNMCFRYLFFVNHLRYSIAIRLKEDKPDVFSSVFECLGNLTYDNLEAIPVFVPLWIHPKPSVQSLLHISIHTLHFMLLSAEKRMIIIKLILARAVL